MFNNKSYQTTNSGSQLMQTKLQIILLLLTIVIGLPATGNSQELFTDEYQFGDPVNLGPNINSAYFDGYPTLTPDGNTIVFMSTRPGGNGGYDLYTAERVNGVWQPAINMGEVVNSSDDEYEPKISPDGNTLFYSLRTAGGYTRVWMTEKIEGEWQAPVKLPGFVNFSRWNNNAQFVSHDGKWLYVASYVGGAYSGNWNVYRYDLTVGDFSIRQGIAGINTAKRDFLIYQTIDEEYLVIYTDYGGWQIKAMEAVDGVYQDVEKLPAPFYDKFTMTENESSLYFHRNLTGGYGSGDIYEAPRTNYCGDFAISSITGAEQIINPLPLAGQTVVLDVTLTGSSAPQNISWALFANNQVVSEGTSLSNGVTWNGRNDTGKIEPGTYDLVLSIMANDGGCMAEKSLTAAVELTDDCLVKVTFP